MAEIATIKVKLSDEHQAQIIALCEKLKAENAKLRDENVRLLSCLTDDAENARQILGESRALRRLVRDMFGQLLNAYDWKELDDFADRMRELGIEVTE